MGASSFFHIGVEKTHHLFKVYLTHSVIPVNDGRHGAMAIVHQKISIGPRGDVIIEDNDRRIFHGGVKGDANG